MNETNQEMVDSMDTIIKKANEGCKDSQYMVVHSYGILDIGDSNEIMEENFKKLFNEEETKYAWLKHWYHHIFSNFKLENLLIHLAKKGDSLARQMLASAYFKGVYYFEQDFDKFKELCDLGWHEALEIKKKFFDCFDNCQIEKTN